MNVIQTIEGPLVLDTLVATKCGVLCGLAKRSYVAIEKGGSQLEFVVWYLACLKMHLIPVVVSKCELTSVFSGIVRVKKKEYFFEKVRSSNLTAPAGIDLVIQTSGSTGNAKFVAYHTEGIQYQIKATRDLLKYDSKSLVLCLSEIWSSYGLSLVHLCLNGSIKLAMLAKQSLRSVFSFINDQRITHIEAVPRFYLFMLSLIKRDSDICRRKISSVIHFGCGGDVLRASLQKEWQNYTGTNLYDGYGLTELGPNVALSCREFYKPGYVGKLLDGTTVRLADDSEIIIRSPSIMYVDWNFGNTLYTRPLELASGDIGEVDADGFLQIKGRKKNVVIVNGVNVYVEEVEALISTSKFIELAFLSSVIIDGKTKLVLCYKGKPGFSHKDVVNFCKDNLLLYQTPSFFLQLENFPFNLNGKIDRIQLRRQVYYFFKEHNDEDSVGNWSV